MSTPRAHPLAATSPGPERECKLARIQLGVDLVVLARSPTLELKFRQSGSLVVPYLEMSVHTPAKEADVFKDARIASPVAAITIGPSPHPEELCHAVGEMTARIGLALVKVESSNVPFRNW